MCRLSSSQRKFVMSALVALAVVSQKAPSYQGGSDRSGTGEEGRVRRGGRCSEVASLCPRCGVRGNVLSFRRGPFLSLFERDPCSSAHATRRLCQRKPRSLAQKIRAGEVTSSSSRIRTDHGRFFFVVVVAVDTGAIREKTAPSASP